jgi:hypothetical protein
LPGIIPTLEALFKINVDKLNFIQYKFIELELIFIVLQEGSVSFEEKREGEKA